MTEPGGRAARWTAAALAAPVVAGVFAGATTWATRVDPLHPQGTAAGGTNGAAAVPAASPATDPAVAALRRQVAAQQLAMNKLADRVAAVRAKAAALAKQNGATVSGTTTGRYAASSGGAATSSSRSGASRSTSSSKPAPAPAPPPPAHGTTGASGSG